jgi:hypothetical protein
LRKELIYIDIHNAYLFQPHIAVDNLVDLILKLMKQN